MNYETAAAKYGTVTHAGQDLALTQYAYCENYGTEGGVRYYAHAIDRTGNEYRVAWDTTPEWEAAEDAYRADPENETPNEDESEACDWSSPAEVIAL